MTEKLESAIVRIYTEDNKQCVGVGLLVSAKRILTCAHVVTDALYLDVTQRDQPTKAVYFDFPFVTPGKVQSAKVIFWRPIQKEHLVTPEKGDDVAGLEINDLLPPKAEPIQLQSFQAIELEGHPFEVFGLPRGYQNGVWATGVALKRLPNG